MNATEHRAQIGLVAVIGLILWFGLHPFDFARDNNVEWLDPGPGLRFGDSGLAVSTKAFTWPSDIGPAAVTVEMWVRASRVSDVEPRAWLVLMDDSKLTPLGVRQEGGDLVVWDAVTNPGGERWYNDFRVPYAMRPGINQHIAITSHDDGPLIYIGGSRAGTYAGYPIPLARKGEPFGGRLVVGAGPPWVTPWMGDVLGLALYDRALTATEVEQHANAGPGSGFAELARNSGAIGAYQFDAGGGTSVQDKAGGEHDLNLPEYFRPPGRGLLLSVDPAERTAPWNLSDALLNVLGFAPLGFLISLVLRKHVKPIPLILSAMLVGFVVSLGIEWAQSLTVTRSSSSQDLVLNTVGSLVGAVAAGAHSRIQGGENNNQP
jgi:VanZ family protein